MIEVNAEEFLTITVCAAVAAVVVATLGRRMVLPVVVVELVLGVIIGPDVLGLVEVDDFTEFFANLGLGFLFFFAGYEIDFARIRGAPMRMALVGWLISVGAAYALAGVLAALGVVLSFVYVASAMSTTAIGTLIPILKDAGEMRTRFGTLLLAAGAIGEFGPILVFTLFLSTEHPVHEAVLLIAFVVVAALIGLLAVRSGGRRWEALERTLESSSQLAVRMTVVLVFALVGLAAELGLDVLLGGFVAGLITRLVIRERDVEALESKLTALGYGFLIPFFFVVSGMRLDLAALGSAEQLAKLVLFVVLFLVVRGLPAMLIYRAELPAVRDRAALALFSAAQLPLVVAITTVAVDSGHMTDGTAAALVGAGMVSTLLYPLAALRLRRDRVSASASVAAEG
ncbi:MAG TPA: cation:proton antiporter [Capillimicrobium sp.]|jgi:Kef-type K+ transport system membrane component KefB